MKHVSKAPYQPKRDRNAPIFCCVCNMPSTRGISVKTALGWVCPDHRVEGNFIRIEYNDKSGDSFLRPIRSFLPVETETETVEQKGE